MAADFLAMALDEAIDDVRSGRATLGECLSRYPELRDELEPLLRVALDIVPPTLTLDPGRRLAARARFIDALYAEPVTQERESLSARLRGLFAAAAQLRPGATAAALSLALDECLADLRSGKLSLEESLARYPKLRTELEPMLRIADSISPLGLMPDPARKLAARVRFIEALYAEPEVVGLGERLQRLLVRPPAMRLGAPTASLALAVALVTSSGAVYASEYSIPGEPLYGVKLAVEQVRVAAARDEESRIEVHLEIASRRLVEVERALESRDSVAAQTAADLYARNIEEAEQRLAKLPVQEEQRVLERLERNLERHQSVLARVADEAPESARPALEEARSRTERGLDRAALAIGRTRPNAGPAAPAASPRTPTSTTAPTAPATSQATPRTTNGAPSSSLGERPVAGGTTEDTSTRPAERRGDSEPNGGRPSSNRVVPPIPDRDRVGTEPVRPPQPETGRQAPQDARAGRDERPTNGTISNGQQENGQKPREVEETSRPSADGGQGLTARLEAVEASLARGQTERAENQLEAVRDQLESLRRRGQISESAYRSLLRAANELGEAIERREDKERSNEAPRPDRERSPASAPATNGNAGRDPGQGLPGDLDLPRQVPAESPRQVPAQPMVVPTDPSVPAIVPAPAGGPVAPPALNQPGRSNQANPPQEPAGRSNDPPRGGNPQPQPNLPAPAVQPNVPGSVPGESRQSSSRGSGSTSSQNRQTETAGSRAPQAQPQSSGRSSSATQSQPQQSNARPSTAPAPAKDKTRDKH